MFKKIQSYFLFGREDKEFSRFSNNLLRIASRSKVSNDGLCGKKILVDCSHLGYPKWNVKLMLIVANRIKNGAGEVHGFYPSRMFIWNSLKSFLIEVVKFVYNKDEKLSRSMGVARLMSINLSDIRALLVAYKSAKAVRDGLRIKQDLLGLKIEGVHVGDLIYDNYLKWFRKPTVELRDLRLLVVLVVAFYFFRKFADLVEREHYSEVYLTHSVYIAFGIAARVSLKNGADVYVTQNTRGLFLQRLTNDHPHQTPRFEKYKESFDSLPSEDKTSAIFSARARLQDRLSGKIDGSISYMRKSAYSSSERQPVELVEYFPGKPYALIMLHCFFDSPHIYKWMLFEDFYEWVVHCLTLLESKGFNVIVKAHPNGLDGNEAVVRALQERFLKANFISSGVSNNDILGVRDVRVALTVYGTVTHEFCYMGLPVINAGDNPHIAYSFSKTPRSLNDFDRALIDVMSGGGWGISKVEIEQFYYMNYMAEKPGYISFYDDVVEAGFSHVCGYQGIFDALEGFSLERLDSNISKCLKDLEVVKDVV